MSTEQENRSILESRNVTVGSKRTSMRLEPQMWEAIELIAERERVTINSLCTQIDRRRRQRAKPVGLTSATRVFIIAYFRHLVARYEDTGEEAETGRSTQASHAQDHDAPDGLDRNRRRDGRDPTLKGASLAAWILDRVVAVDVGDGFAEIERHPGRLAWSNAASRARTGRGRKPGRRRNRPQDTAVASD